jgi:chromosome partitioning protein
MRYGDLPKMEVGLSIESDMGRLLERFKIIAQGDTPPINRGPKYSRYAVTNFRGGIGKSTIAFNLAWEISRQHKTMLMDVCPQRNFSQSLLGEDIFQVGKTVYDLLIGSIFSGVNDTTAEDALVSIPPSCLPFKNGKSCHLIPGSSDLFLFPSVLYSQIAAVSQLPGAERARDASKQILTAVMRIIDAAVAETGAEKVLIDTSPFFGGATHLAWVAAEALVIPVRVDQHSVDALRQTLAMLKENKQDFLRLNAQAGIGTVPKVHAIAITHCGWNRQNPNTPDHSTQSYVKIIMEIIEQYRELFSHEDIVDSIHLLDDFHSAGRISGSRRIPLAQLRIGQQATIGGQKLEVNQSITRYQAEVKALAQVI